MRIGIDLVVIDRLGEAFERNPRLKERLFSPGELAYCERKPRPLQHLAGTLAAKEAVIKTLRLQGLVSSARRLEVVRDRTGAPEVRVDLEHEPGRVRVSISHHDGIAVAVACAPAPPRVGLSEGWDRGQVERA